MEKNTKKRLRRDRIRRRIRSTIRGTSERPRLCIYKSNKHVNAQLVDDLAGVTIVSVSTESDTLEKDLKDKSKVERAGVVGEQIAKLAQDQGIKKAVFDRSGYKYHGVVKAFAEGARNGGLDF